MNEVVQNMLKEDTLPLKHQVGRYIVGGIAGIVASAGARKGYMLVLEALKDRKAAAK